MDWGGGTIMSVVEETDKFELAVTVMVALIGHLADYQMPGRGRA
jgi:hypothetical protein